MNWADAALAPIRADEPGLRVHVEWHPDYHLAELSFLLVPPHRRGRGIARRAVAALVAAADQNGAALTVTPSGDFGASVTRLRRFYAGFGFLPNTGAQRNWNTRADMIRPPAGGTTALEES